MEFAQPKSQYSHVLKPYPSWYIYSVFQILLDYVIDRTHDLAVGVLLPYLAILLNLVTKLMAGFFECHDITLSCDQYLYIYTYIVYTYRLYIYTYICICMYVIIKTISPDSYQTHALEQMLFVLQYIYGNIYIYIYR